MKVKTKEEKILKYYVLCNRLKNLIRTGWKDWNVKRERIESVAEHIYGVQMLAIAIYSEYKYDIDIYKVIYMIAIHELEEIKIGDLTQFQITKEEKKKIGHEAVKEVISELSIKEELMSLVEEYDKRESKEALFAHYCDKLECDIQCKLYDEEKCVDLENQQDNLSYYDKNVQRLLEENKSWSSMWIRFGQEKNNFDKNFLAISNYAKDHKLKDLED